jgi:hypothetical protein
VLAFGSVDTIRRQAQRVEPYFDNDRGAWGFWFLGLWIPM